MDTIARIISSRDDITYAEALEMVEEARERVQNGEDPEEILLDEFGLEPDYIFELL